MKIIDLLNKIANGEEVPKKIKYQNYEYVFNQVDKEYQRWFNGLSYGFGEDRRLDIILDEEVQILEEEKKIPEKSNIDFNTKLPVSGCSENEAFMMTCISLLGKKIDSLIDYLKSKGE